MNNTKEFDFRRNVLYPACAVFCILVFVYFLMAMATGLNVTETETVKSQIYDGDTDQNVVTSGGKEPAALPVQTLLGLFLFALSIMALNLVFKLNVTHIYARLIHYVGTLISFLIFVMALSGTSSVTGVPAVVVALLLVSVIYFLVLGICVIARRLFDKIESNKKLCFVKKYASHVFAGFAVIVFAVSLFALISQFNVIVKLKEEKTFITDKKFEEVFVTVVTPLAPTIQNYLRYLASSAVFATGYAVLFTKLNNPIRVLINFLVLSAGYMGIWIIGFDYFRLVKSNALTAVIIYLSAYIVVLLAVCIVLYVKKRKSEKTEDYEAQFSVKRKSK